MNWNADVFYAFPPFVLVGRCLQNIRGNNATGILIAPMWPTQSYFVCLLSMLVDNPRYFKATRTTLTNSSMGEQVQPLKVNLMVCRVSGNPLLSAEFRWKLPTSSCHRGGEVLLSNTTSSLQNGTNFVYQDKVISCKPLFQ